MVVSGGNEDLVDFGGFFYGGYLEISYGSLEGVDGINFGDEYMGIYILESESIVFVNIIEISNNINFVSNYYVGGVFDVVNEGFVVVV